MEERLIEKSKLFSFNLREIRVGPHCFDKHRRRYGITLLRRLRFISCPVSHRTDLTLAFPKVGGNFNNICALFLTVLLIFEN